MILTFGIRDFNINNYKNYYTRESKSINIFNRNHFHYAVVTGKLLNFMKYNTEAYALITHISGTCGLK